MSNVIQLGRTKEEVQARIQRSRIEKHEITEDNVLKFTGKKDFTKADENPDISAIGTWRMNNLHRPHGEKLSFQEWCEKTNYVPTKEYKLVA